MASKVIYSAVAVVGIAAAAGAAYWYQNKSTGPKEITAAGAASAPAGGASAAGGPPRGGGMPSVEVAKVEASRLQDDAQAVGSLRSKQNVMLRPEVSGRVQTLGFTDGGRVRRGDVIMQLEDGLQRAEVRQAEAQMSIARATLKRNQELVAQNFVAQRVVDESGASVQVAEAQVSLACARWDRMRVVAPFDGTVGIRNVNIGDYVKDGADLVNLEDLSSMFVDFRLPERFVGKIRREQTIEMQLDAMPGRQFKAKIDAIDPQLDANGRSVLIRAVLPNSPGEPLAQRPGGPGGQGGAPGGPGGPAGAAGTGGRPAGAGGAPGAPGAPSAGGKPAEKPAMKAAARPPQRPVSAPAAAAPRPVDPIAASCAQFTNAAVVARAAVGGAAGSSSGASGLAGVGGGRNPGAGGAGGAPARAAGGQEAAGSRVAGNAPSAGRPAGAGGSAAAGGRGGPGGAAGAGGGGGGGPLRPGMFARVTAVFNVKETALTIPEEAIVPQGGRQFVIRVVEQTEAQGKEIADKQAADAAKALEAAKAAAAASSAPVSAGAGGGAPGGAPGGPGAGGAQPYNMSGFVDGKRLVSQRQEVKLGIRRPGRVEITEGLAEGETIVVAGQQRVQRDNTPVRVIELGRAPGAPGGAPSSAPGGAPNLAAGGAPNAASGSVGGATPATPAASAPTPAASR